MQGAESHTYESLRAGFRWNVPASFNIGIACCDNQPPRSPALFEITGRNEARTVTLGELRKLSKRFANAPAGLGVVPGDRATVGR